jgi:acetyl-CoA carboxylase biotin carboxylase subunit
MVTGADLVAEQIRVAGGEPLSLEQSQVRLGGHAIECRINAEDAERDFMPVPGRLSQWDCPSGPGIRIDTHCYAGYLIPPFYDSMVGKLIVHAADRPAAVSAMQRALAAFKVNGVPTTIPFHKAVLAHPDFTQGRVTTRWVEEVFMKQSPAKERAA